MTACPECSRDNPGVARFCMQCGASLAAACPACGTAAPSSARFCMDCGADLTVTTEGSLTPASARAGGERKQITVLFADVAGSMDLQERLDAEVWAAIMGRFVSILAEGVRNFGGTVDTFTGDGIMALFGAPVAQEDHARRACHAAWHLTKTIGEYSEELQRDHGIDLQVRLGLNSGEVVVGRVGDGVTLDPTALGHTVGLAQRMEAMAEPGRAYLTGNTARLVEGYFDLRRFGSRRVKGSASPVDVFALAGPGSARTSLEVAAARGLSRFVGREREMAVLEAALADARHGEGRVVGVLAEPGVGKSRLCHEFAERCRAAGVEVVACHALSHAQSVPFITVLGMLRTTFRIADQDGPEEARRKITGEVLDLAPDLMASLPLLFDFLGVADPDYPAPVMDADARRRQLSGVFDRLRRARGDRAAFVIVVEDLHWLDPASESFLEDLLAGLPGSRILVVTTMRPEYRPPWAHRPYYAQLPLAPLARDSSEALVTALLGSDPSTDRIACLVGERTGGNPFFIEELVHTLVDDGTLEGERGAYRLEGRLDEIRIPATVTAVLTARVDRLGHLEKVVLQTAAVAGRRFSRRLLARLLGHEPLGTVLRTLAESELIYQTSSYPDEEYAFKHALVEEVAYRSQLTNDRTTLHGKLARALIELDVSKADEQAALIAHHFELAGAPLDAARWAARAATWAGFSHPVEAIRLWRHVRTLTEHLDLQGEAGELRFTAAITLLMLGIRMGATVEADDEMPYEEEGRILFADAEMWARAAGQPAWMAALRSTYCAFRQFSHSSAEGSETLGREAVCLADQTTDPTMRLASRATLGNALFLAGRVHEAVALIKEGLEIFGAERDLGRGLITTSLYAWYHMAYGYFGNWYIPHDDCLTWLDRALNIADEEGDPENRAWIQRTWAVVAERADIEPDRAAIHAEEALRWGEQAGSVLSRIRNREGLAISHLQRQQWPDALRVTEEALGIQRDHRLDHAHVGYLLDIRSRAQLGAGDVAAARRSARQAIAAAARWGARHYEAGARISLARAILADPHQEDVNTAEKQLEQASTIIHDLGLSALAPHIHLERASLARLVGDDATTQDELQVGHRLFGDMAAAGRARRLEAELTAGATTRKGRR